METTEFGIYLKTLRNAKGYTLTELGDMIGYSNPYLSQIENGRKKTMPPPSLLRKLAGPLGVDYEKLMIKAGYWDERYTEENKNLFEKIHDDHWNDMERISEVLKSLADDEGIFPDYLHKELFEILQGQMPWYEYEPRGFDERFVEFLSRKDDEISDSDVEDAHNDFNKIYNYKNTKTGLSEYNGYNKTLEDFLHELLQLAQKHEIPIGASKLSFSEVELSEILRNQSYIIKHNNILLSPQDRNRIIGYIDALLLFPDRQ